MSKLNRTKSNDILLYLENEHFTLFDFEVEFPDQGNLYVSVTFRHNRNYFFSISEELVTPLATIAAFASGAEHKTRLQTLEAPGDFKDRQIHQCDTFDECIRRIPIWCKNLFDELRARNPELNDIRELQAELESRFNQHIEDPESHFSKEELERVYQNLDSLAEKVKQMEENHTITQAQLKHLLAEIEVMKTNAASLPKGIWAGLTKNRAISFVKKIGTSPEVRKLAFDVAEKFLLGPKP